MKNFYRHLISGFIRLFFLFKNHNLLAFFFSKREQNAKYIIYVPNFLDPRYLAGDGLIKDLHNFNLLKKNGQSIRIVSSLKKIKNKKDKILLFQGSKFLNNIGFDDHSSALRNLSRQAEKEFKNVFPNYHESKLWENKDFMHDLFEEKKISTPKTFVIELKDHTFEDLSSLIKDNEFLIKELNSRSAEGVHKISSKKDLENLKTFLGFSKKVILQKLIDMRKDLRVILVGSEIILYYWRINNQQEWLPTSTGYGSSVDFDFFPEKWRNYIIDSFKKLEVRTGAFDICWEKDDLETNPLILEVSTLYQPNPRPKSLGLINYGKWKKSLSFSKNGYIYSHIETIFDIQEKFIKNLLK